MHRVRGLERDHHSLAVITQSFQMKKHGLNWERGCTIWFKVLPLERPAKQQLEVEGQLLDLCYFGK